jgi:hypothetical protein
MSYRGESRSLSGRTKQEAPLAKIGIFGDDDQGVLGCVSPDRLVVRSFQSNLANVDRTGVEGRQFQEQPWREILI